MKKKFDFKNFFFDLKKTHLSELAKHKSKQLSSHIQATKPKTINMEQIMNTNWGEEAIKDQELKEHQELSDEQIKDAKDQKGHDSDMDDENQNQIEILIRVNNKHLSSLEDNRNGIFRGYEAIENEVRRRFRCNIHIRTTRLNDGRSTMVAVACRNYLPRDAYDLIQDRFGEHEQRNRRRSKPKRHHTRKPRKPEQREVRKSGEFKLTQEQEKTIPLLIGRHKANLKTIAQKYPDKRIFIKHPQRNQEEKVFQILAKDQETVDAIIQDLQASLDQAMSVMS